jgi:hypothetical protein
MPWIYFTDISPMDDQNNSFNEAFNFFLEQCIINKDRLRQYLSNGQCYRFLIRTDGENDKIICKDGKVFLKSKFLNNKIFKRNLIDYYKPQDVFVKGPKEIIRRDGSTTNKWMIELMPTYSNSLR